MTIRPSTINVSLIPPRIGGTMLLHDDQTHTVVPISIEPADTPPGFEVAPPRGDTYRDDFDDYRREAERIMHMLLTSTSEATAARDRELSSVANSYHLGRLELDREWQALRWRFIRGDAGVMELETAAIKRSDPQQPRHDTTDPDGVDDDGRNWYL